MVQKQTLTFDLFELNLKSFFPLFQALYENMLIELPFASFFLSKMLGQHNLNVDIDHLQSLDPELYKNLLYLKVKHNQVQI